jgi:hypothetical protein
MTNSLTEVGELTDSMADVINSATFGSDVPRLLEKLRDDYQALLEDVNQDQLWKHVATFGGHIFEPKTRDKNPAFETPDGLREFRPWLTEMCRVGATLTSTVEFLTKWCGFHSNINCSIQPDEDFVLLRPFRGPNPPLTHQPEENLAHMASIAAETIQTLKQRGVKDIKSWTERLWRLQWATFKNCRMICSKDTSHEPCAFFDYKIVPAPSDPETGSHIISHIGGKELKPYRDLRGHMLLRSDVLGIGNDGNQVYQSEASLKIIFTLLKEANDRKLALVLPS